MRLLRTRPSKLKQFQDYYGDVSGGCPAHSSAPPVDAALADGATDVPSAYPQRPSYTEFRESMYYRDNSFARFSGSAGAEQPY